MPAVVVALGGNAIALEGGGLDLQGPAVAISQLVGLGWGVVLIHGSGPQVGARLGTSLPAQGARSLDVLDAETQGAMGYGLQQAISNELSTSHPRGVVSLITQVVVDPEDRAFRTPTKPVGPFLGAADAEALRHAGLPVVEDSGRGYRRVVASPEPMEIVEWRAIAALLSAGVVVVAAGGGGIPVARGSDGRLRGVEAVVDKDRAAALLARVLHAELLLILTSVAEVCLDYRQPTEHPLRRLSVAEARRYLSAGQFAEGSMGPKVDAAARFTAASGHPSVITTARGVLDALLGTRGTTIHP
jgi:carbamate kinase